MLFYAILPAGIVSAVIFMALRVKEGGVRAMLMKAFTSILFVLCGIVALVHAGHTNLVYSTLIVFGLALGMLGDIWLDLKWVYPNSDVIYTFSGFISFALGHVMFISALLFKYADFSKITYIIFPAVFSLIIAVGMIILEKPMKMMYGKFKIITAIYSFILSYTTFLSGSLAIMNSFKIPTINIMFIGGVFFMISDLILSGTYFGDGKNRNIDVITNHASYYIAQFLIASSLMFIK